MSTPAEPNTTGPAVGDRVEVRVTGTVVQVHTGKYPSLQISLNEDLVVATSEEGVLTHERPDRVVLLRSEEASR